MQVSFPQKNNFATLTADRIVCPLIDSGAAADLLFQRDGNSKMSMRETEVVFYQKVRLSAVDIVDNARNVILSPDGTGGITTLANVASATTFNSIPVTERFLEGVANKQFIPCVFLGDMANRAWEWKLSNYAATNLGADDSDFVFMVPLPTNLYGKRLYLKNVIVAILDADAGDYVTNVTVEGIEAGSNITLNTSPTDIDAPADPEIVFTAVDLSGYSMALVQIDCVNTDALDFEIGYVAIEAYYDT